MPITFQPSKNELPMRTPRGRAFDVAIKKLAPTISHLQAGECPRRDQTPDWTIRHLQTGKSDACEVQHADCRELRCDRLTI